MFGKLGFERYNYVVQKSIPQQPDSKLRQY